MYIEGDIPTVVSNGTGNNANGMGWGGDWIWAFLIFALLGWGGRGFGGYGGGNGGGGVMDAYVLNSDFATLQRQIDSGFSGVTAGINQVNQGLCNGFYTQAQLINGVQMQVANEFRGLDNAICTLGYNTQGGFNSLATLISQCCCENKAAIADLKYTIANEGCATRQAIADGTNAVIGFMTNQELAALRSENQSLKFAASQSAQNAYLLNELKPCPRPAYITCNPYMSYPFYGQQGNNGCCGCNG